MTVTRGATAPEISRQAAPRPETQRRPRASTRISRATFVEGLAAIVLSGLLLLLATSAAAAVTQAGYQLDHAKHVLATAQDGEHQLEVQVASLQAPDRIDQIATTQLGMRRPSRFDTVQPLPVANVPAAVPHSAAIAVAQITPGPGSVPALWDSLRAFVAHMR
jgi:cell division protein FtsL